MYLNSKEFLELWQLNHGNLKRKHIEMFLNDKRMAKIIQYKAIMVEAACIKHKRFDDILLFLEQLNNFRTPSTSQPKLDKFDFSIKLQTEARIAEKLLWNILKDNPENMKFEFQYIILGYIADFYYADGKMVIELDGKIHNKTISADAKRSQIMGMSDIAVYRFSNEEVISNPEKIAKRIIDLGKKRFKAQQDLFKEAFSEDKIIQDVEISVKKMKVELPKPKKLVFRCEKCANVWIGISSKNKCHTCKSSRDVIRLCDICKLRQVPDKISFCKVCIDARQVRKSEVGASKQRWRQGKHRARKVK